MPTLPTLLPLRSCTPVLVPTDPWDKTDVRNAYSYVPMPQNYANVVNAVPTPFLYNRAGAYGPLGQTDVRTAYSYVPMPQNYANVAYATPTPFMYTRAGAYGPLGQADGSTGRIGYSSTPAPQSYGNVVKAVPTPFLYTKAEADRYAPYGQRVRDGDAYILPGLGSALVWAFVNGIWQWVSS